MANARRTKKKQRFYYNSAKGPDEKKIVLENYYDKHQKSVNNAVEKYKQRKHIVTNKTNKQIFVDELKNTARDWGSARQAKEAIEKKLVEYRGGDIDWYEARHGYGKEDFGDLRKLNKFKPTYVQYDFEISYDRNVVGYYTLPISGMKIAKVRYTNNGRSPVEHWEYLYNNEIGL